MIVSIVLIIKRNLLMNTVQFVYLNNRPFIRTLCRDEYNQISFPLHP